MLFIATANSMKRIPGPLRDRMEVIEIPGYPLEDKIPIANRHIWPKQIKQHGLDLDKVEITEQGIQTISMIF